jgi:alpha-L-glutamate ligase-like protein
MIFKTYRELHKKGILSINQRNKDFVLKYNSREFYPLVDDKLQTKRLALQAGIAVPKLYAQIETEHQIKKIDSILEPFTDFVIKPAHGSGGDGILVIVGKIGNRYRLINGKLLSPQELSYHLSRLLSGAYSLGGHHDYAIIEQRVVVDPVFNTISYQGVPDVRVITLMGYPVMSMLRLPTRTSGGKANLHQGAIGAGIDIHSGLTLNAVSQNEIVDTHPDTMHPTSNVQIPYWDEILQIAASCYELTGMGYLGVDIVIDATAGPLMLELNARPGLNIQIANQEGLLHRLRQVEARAAHHPHEAILSRIRFSQTAFQRTPAPLATMETLLEVE